MPAIDLLFDQLLARGQRDLHLAVDSPPMIRVGGELVALREQPLDADEMAELLQPVLTAEQHERLAAELDLDFAYVHEGHARFRVSCFHEMAGVAAVFRAIPTKVPTLAEIGGPSVLRRLSERRSGLVLVSGPAGSGRSTTMAAMLHHINETRACHILSIESPIELLHTPFKAQVTQRDVGLHASSYAAALRSAAREDADVVRVGRLEGAEAIRLALHLASSGALVLAAIDACGAVAAVEQLLHAAPEPWQPEVRGLLAGSLAGVVSHQLLRAADGAGKVVAYEILVGTSVVADLLREGATGQLQAAIEDGQAVGMQTHEAAVERLVAEGRAAG